MVIIDLTRTLLYVNKSHGLSKSLDVPLEFVAVHELVACYLALVFIK